ncbi:hypothetical protein JR316_0000153 [Psilocybe cubensis]|uniref:Uncharacterized protein n=1 Tax=Psilocybe cubensis TaxID=181762 RepID=A0ACB8HEG2_PSICU|nr:hypothetical protein JR316_0000153 [Psilocybe cubensis]KAH9486089.1 hypothetical protein JR316_0000153 [Psilocybe cubensis]
MSADACFESAEFRQHIRALLYEYIITHCTTDYLTFTEGLVSEFLQDLKPVPLTDPYSFIIPVEPFQTFSQTHNLESLPPYDEILQTTHEALLYLKNVMHSTKGVPKTLRLEWSERSHDVLRLNEPLFPALTRRSRTQTPKLGKVSSSVPRKLSTLVQVHKLEPLAVEPVQEEKLDFEGIMKVKHHINPPDLPAVQSILKRTADAMRYMPSYKNRYLDPESLCQVVLKPPQVPEDPFMPLFPRSRKPGFGASGQAQPLPTMKNFAELPAALDEKVKVEDIDGDISMQNLVVVSGWQAIQSSPPSTQSGHNSDSEDQHDQLLFPSSPDTSDPPLVEEIEKTKMEVLIPRSRKIGGKSGIAPHILAGKTLQAFLQPLLVPTSDQLEVDPKPDSNSNVPERTKLNASPTPSSVVGQASDNGTSTAENCNSELNQERSLEDEIAALYSGPMWQEAIMNEPLDDKRDLLMEVHAHEPSADSADAFSLSPVPILPEPNVHPPGDLDIPKTYTGFLVPPPESTKQETNPAFIKPEPAFQFLKKVKGKQALSLALSWVPFTVSKKLPSVIELLGVDDLFGHGEGQDGEQPRGDVAEAARLLEALEVSISQDNGHRFSWTEGTGYRPIIPPKEFRLLLNRQERRRVVNDGVISEGEEAQCVGAMDVDVDEIEVVDEVRDMPLSSSSVSVKRQRSLCVPGDDAEDFNVKGHAEDDRFAKRPRLDEHHIASSLSPSPEDVSCVRPSLPLLPAYGDDEYGRIDPGYLSPVSCYMQEEEDKENWPPFSSSDQDIRDEYFHDRFERRNPEAGGEYDCYMAGYDRDEGEESFEPLSFDSRYLPSGAEKETQEAGFNDDEFPNRHPDATPANQHDILNGERGTTSANAQDEMLFEPDIASRSLGILAFAQLRARKISAPTVPSSPLSAPAPVAPSAKDVIPIYRGAPEELFDADTIIVSGSTGVVELPVHRYMASLALIQKHGLVRALRSAECAIELIERETLGGVDLIVDPYCAVLFVSLFTLPSMCAAEVEKVAQLSWRFSYLLVVFEAYPENCAKRFVVDKDKNGGGEASELYAYTPPILKAIKKFRRDINIADACGTKRGVTVVQYSFADSVRDAAVAARIFGSQAEERDETFGVIWATRPWLSADFIESEEQALAGLDGMNHFSASMILSQITLEEFLQLEHEERMQVCAGLLHEEILAKCSADVERRTRAMYSSSDT